MAEFDAGELPCCRSRWADLPADLLAAVFQHVLCPPSCTGAGTPLRPLLHQLLALSHTCRHWAAVAAKFPIDLELYAASPAGRAWLARRPLRRLRLASSPAEAVEEAAEAALLGLPPASADDRRDPTVGNAQQDDAPLPSISEALAAAAAVHGAAQMPLHDFRAARSVGWRGEAEGLFPWVAAAAGHSLTSDGMLQELDGVADWSTLQASGCTPREAPASAMHPTAGLRTPAGPAARPCSLSGQGVAAMQAIAAPVPRLTSAGATPQDMGPLIVALA